MTVVAASACPRSGPRAAAAPVGAAGPRRRAGRRARRRGRDAAPARALGAVLDRRGHLGRDRVAPARRDPGRCCARTARRRCTTCCCTCGWRSSARPRSRRTRCRRASPSPACRRHGGRWRPSGRWAGLVAGGLMALDPFVGLYADETRMYSLLLLLALLVCGAFLRAFVAAPPSPLASFAVLLALALYSSRGARSSSARRGWRGWRCSWSARPAHVRTRRRARLRRRRAALRAVGADPALPGRPHRRAVVAPPDGPVADACRQLGSGAGGAPSSCSCPPPRVGLAIAALRGGRRARAAVLAVAVIAAATVLAAFAYSRYGTPAWALRYLVVVLAPLALLVALGLGRLSLLGPLAVLAASLLAWHGRPAVATLEHKSNVTQVARELAPALPRGTLVFSTQPEQVPELAHELPGGPALRDAAGDGGRRRRHGLARRAGAPERRPLRRGPRAADARAAPRGAPAPRPARVQPPRLAVDAEDPRHRAPMGPRGAAAAASCAGCGRCAPRTAARARRSAALLMERR